MVKTTKILEITDINVEKKTKLLPQLRLVLANNIIFLLTGLRIYTGNTKRKARCNARPKGRHYEGRRLLIHPYEYASKLVRSLLPD